MSLQGFENQWTLVVRKKGRLKHVEGREQTRQLENPDDTDKGHQSKKKVSFFEAGLNIRWSRFERLVSLPSKNAL